MLGRGWVCGGGFFKSQFSEFQIFIIPQNRHTTKSPDTGYGCATATAFHPLGRRRRREGKGRGMKNYHTLG
jgi:hypothetical protein